MVTVLLGGFIWLPLTSPAHPAVKNALAIAATVIARDEMWLVKNFLPRAELDIYPSLLRRRLRDDMHPARDSPRP